MYVKKSDFYVYKYLFQIEVNVLDYDKFSNSQLSLISLISFLILIVIFSIALTSARMEILLANQMLRSCYSSDQINILWFNTILQLVGSSWYIILMLSVILLFFQNFMIKYFKHWKSWIIDFSLIFLTFNASISLLTKVYIGSCSKYTHCDPTGIYCNIAGFNSLPIVYTVFLIFLPPMAKTIVREISCTIFLLTWLLVIITFAIGSTMTHWRNDLYVFFIIYVSFSLFYAVEIVRQHLNLYISTKHLKQEIKKKKKLLSENRSKEIKCMITNVAYELKHPLSSFFDCIDTIKQCSTQSMLSNSINVAIEDHNKSIANRSSINNNTSSNGTGGNIISKDVKNLNQNLSSIINSVDDLQYSNNFMMMTMNRCMDYTLATNAVPLVPCLESIDWKHCLQLPIDMIKQQHPDSNINLQLLLLDEDDKNSDDDDDDIINRWIVTDKQWLQDNMFCLLANAIVDSNIITIQIKVSLTANSSSTTGNNKSSTSNNISKNTTLDLTLNRTSTGIEKQIFSDYLKKNKVHLLSKGDDLSDTYDIHSIDSSITNNLVTTYTNNNKDVVEYILFEVIMIGSVLSDEVKKLLFEPFSYDDIKGYKRVLGTGLGLFSLVNRIKALKGYYGIFKYNSDNNNNNKSNNNKDQVSEGNIFWFSIPYVKSIPTSLR